MSNITLERTIKETIVRELQNYFDSELNVELGQFDGEFLLDFIIEKVGPAVYNQGISDARAVLERRIQSIDEDLYAIEK
ncbi:DUF2164 domain-containing protein [Alteromonas gracilis]|uniref:DUF2164 domain-containing protein n=1 Tax=Alteromonas gracilis TaxID=1479524 RepID=UPI003735BD7E